MTAPVLPAHLLDTLDALADGCTRAQMAARLRVPYTTVKQRLKTLYGALGARNGMHAVALGFRLGLLPVRRLDGAA